jgi:hypothetical protein
MPKQKINMKNTQKIWQMRQDMQNVDIKSQYTSVNVDDDNS